MWLWQGKEINEIPEGYQGFVYLITLKDGKKYIGKKNFYFIKTKQVNKKKKRYNAESDWKEYYGSSDYVNQLVEEHGKDTVTREIIHLCKTKSDMSYWETYHIFALHALLSEDYLNGWVSCKIHKKNVFGKITIDA